MDLYGIIWILWDWFEVSMYIAFKIIRLSKVWHCLSQHYSLKKNIGATLAGGAWTTVGWVFGWVRDHN